MKKTLSLLCASSLIFAACDKKESGEPEKETSTAKAVVTDTAKAVNLPASEQAAIKTIRYAVKPGEVYRYRLTATNTIESDTLRIETKTTQYYTKKVKSVRSDGSIEMLVRYDSMMVNTKRTNTKNPAQNFQQTLNTNNPSDQKHPEFKRIAILMGEDVTMLVTPKGSIEEVSGLTPIYNKLVGNQKDSITADQKNYIIESIKTEMYAIPLKQEYLQYPDSTIDSNRSWSKTFQQPIAGMFPAKSVLSLNIQNVKEMNGSRILEIGESIKSVVVNPKVENEQLMARLEENKTTGTGRLLVDQEKGFTILKKETLSQFVTATLTVKQQKREEKKSQKISSSTTFELLR